jgi:hypothetical protein
MSHAGSWVRTGALLLLIAPFAPSLHLALERHEWLHEEHGDTHRHDPDREPHPAADHELPAVAKTSKLILSVVDVILVRLEVVLPTPRTWSPVVEPDVHSQPDALASPPRSPRAPPA